MSGAEAGVMPAGTQSAVSARAYLPYAAAVACLYGAASWPGHAIVIPNVFVAPIRLSAGLAIAALILAPARLWWLVLLAMIPSHAWVGDPANRYAVAMQYFTANAAEALAGAFLLRQFAGVRPRLDNLKPCVAFLVTCVLIGPLVGATIGAPAIIRRDLTISALSTWEVWAFADAAGNVVMVPVCLAMAEFYSRRRIRIEPRITLVRAGEAVAVWLGILMTTAPALGQSALGRRAPLSVLYAPFPFLVWASMRFGPPGAAAANLMLTIVTILYALTAGAPFGQPWSANSVLETQQFLIVAGATSITLAALTAERWRAYQAAREGEERQRLAFESARLATWVWVFKDDRFHVSVELAALTGLDPAADYSLTSIVPHIHPDGRADALEDLMARSSGWMWGTILVRL